MKAVSLNINPFLEATCQVLELFQFQCETGDPISRDSFISSEEILCMIGLTGVIRGHVYFEISSETMTHIVSRMMGGMEVSFQDEMAQSAICEMGNMICGNAITRFSQEGILMDITPPTLLTGKEIQINAPNMSVQSVPVSIEGADRIGLTVVVENAD